MDPENDSTLAMIHEFVKRGHGMAITTPANLTIRDSVAFAFCKCVVRTDKIGKTLKSFHNSTTFYDEMLPMAGFDVIVPCGLEGVDMTSIRCELERAGQSVPADLDARARRLVSEALAARWP